jgi:ribosomal-protein-alanine N-acetyltransferase
MLQLNFAPFPLLNTDRLILRKLDQNDDAELFRLRSDDGINKYIGNVLASNIEDVVTWRKKVQTAMENNKSAIWAITLATEQTLAGYITLWNIVPETATAELGYTMKPEYEGQGIMQEAFDAVLHYAFDIAGFKTIEAYTHGDNVRSTKLLERNGFKRNAELEQKKVGTEEPITTVIYTKNKD